MPHHTVRGLAVHIDTGFALAAADTVSVSLTPPGKPPLALRVHAARNSRGLAASDKQVPCSLARPRIAHRASADRRPPAAPRANRQR